MIKNKKIVLTIIVILLICMFFVLAVLFILPKLKNNSIASINILESQVVEEELESRFLSRFSEINYLQDDNQEIVSTVFEYCKSKENKYDVNIHLPKINFDTCEDINSEIINTFGTKLLDIVKKSEQYTKYNVDYISYTNEGIISLIIKCTLNEGNSAQRVIIKTYNYNINDEKQITLEELVAQKGLNKEKIEQQINSIIRKKNTNAKEYQEQGYNIYVRDVNSSKYNIENIENFFIDSNGDIYIIFAYGNNNFTQTMDIIKVKTT